MVEYALDDLGSAAVFGDRVLVPVEAIWWGICSLGDGLDTEVQPEGVRASGESRIQTGIRALKRVVA